MHLIKREIDALKAIESHQNYSAFWTPKTNESLQEKGLVSIDGMVVHITLAGKNWLVNYWLEENAPQD